MNRTTTILLLGLLTMFLTACSSSGEGVVAPPIPLIPLVPDASLTNPAPTPSDFSWSTSTPNTASTISGIGQTAGSLLEATNNKITALSSSVIGGASLRITYNGRTNTAATRATSVITEAAGITTNASEFVGTLERNSGTPAGLFRLNQFKTPESSASSVSVGIMNPYSAGWNYQTFGLWNQRSSTNNARGAIGAISVGLETPGAAIPTTGSATYLGFAYGYAFANGAMREVTSTMRAEADFGNSSPSILFSTTNSFIAPVAGPISTHRPADEFNLTGTLSYSPGANTITGNVQSRGTLSAAGVRTGQLNGRIHGRFYGPGAQEIGGTFDLGTGTNRFFGGFGGKQ